MKINKTNYGIFFVIVILSFVALLAVPVGTIAQTIAALPLSATLIAALFQLFRDESRFQKEKLAQAMDQRFSLSISSHMAAVAFDRHVNFCEEYREAVIEGTTTLFQDGPAKSALDVSWNLHKCRSKHGLWITEEINNSLLDFERNIRSIGANSHLLERLDTGKERSELIAQMYNLFLKVTEISKGEIKNEEVEEVKIATINSVLNSLQDILGIKELTELRGNVIKSANKSMVIGESHVMHVTNPAVEGYAPVASFTHN